MSRHNLGALAALFFFVGCGPTTITVTTTGGEGEAGTTGDPSPGTTGLGATDTGVLDTGGDPGASSGGTSLSLSSSGGGSSTTTGEPPLECFVDPDFYGQWGCWCGDELADPSACGCETIDGACVCPFGESPIPCRVPGCAIEHGACVCDGSVYPQDSCVWPCVLDESGVCCVPGLPCWCDDLVPPQPCMAGLCYDPATGACACDITSNGNGCFCGAVEVPPAYCS